MKKSIAAGVMISLGGMVFLGVDNTAVGAFAFSIGLLIICIYGLHLFTGKAPYMRFTDAFNIILIFIGNLIGAMYMGLFTRFARPQIVERANQICQNKLSEGLWVIFLGMVCNVFIFLQSIHTKPIKMR